MVPNAKFVAFENGKAFAPLLRACLHEVGDGIENVAGCRRDVRWPEVEAMITRRGDRFPGSTCRHRP
jgi:hypothetical protein